MKARYPIRLPGQSDGLLQREVGKLHQRRVDHLAQMPQGLQPRFVQPHRLFRPPAGRFRCHPPESERDVSAGLVKQRLVFLLGRERAGDGGGHHAEDLAIGLEADRHAATEIVLLGQRAAPAGDRFVSSTMTTPACNSAALAQ